MAVWYVPRQYPAVPRQGARNSGPLSLPKRNTVLPAAPLCSS